MKSPPDRRVLGQYWTVQYSSGIEDDRPPRTAPGPAAEGRRRAAQ
ncbi:MAG TPA: hypothetical protein VHW26_00245 [Solirubrobacteraceae bacterium]|nr:hypothetical protein [Solirubrobacteraceae bacterium]